MKIIKRKKIKKTLITKKTAVTISVASFLDGTDLNSINAGYFLSRKAMFNSAEYIAGTLFSSVGSLSLGRETWNKNRIINSIAIISAAMSLKGFNSNVVSTSNIDYFGTKKSSFDDFRDVVTTTFPYKWSAGNFVNDKYLLVDADLNSKQLNNFKSSSYYTTTSVFQENPKKFRNINQNHILPSYDFTSFKDGILNITDPTDNSTATIYLNKTEMVNSIATCMHYGYHQIVATLTSDTGSTAYICETITKSDISLIIWAVAFPNKYFLLTDDACLGVGLKGNNSFSPSKIFFGRIIINIK